MLLFNRRAILALALGVGVTGCGFTPVYQDGTAASNLQGQIDIELVKGRNGFELRQQLENRLGRATSNAPYMLRFDLSLSETNLAVTADEGTTRVNVAGIANFTVRNKDSGEVIYKDTVRNITAYGTTSATYPSSVAKRDAHNRLAKALAEQISNRIAITAKDWAG